MNPVQVGQQLTQVVNRIARTKKRHDDITTGIVNARSNAFGNLFDHQTLAEYLNRKFKQNEGIIISHEFYKRIFGISPHELNIADLQHELTKKDLSVAPIYKKLNESDIQATAVFIVIHKNQFQAIEYADELRSIITGQPKSVNPKVLLVQSAIKITDQLQKCGSKVTKEDLLDALVLLAGNEVYCVSINYFEEHQIDPRPLEQFLEAKGFKVCRLYDSNPRVETEEIYKYYDGLQGLLVSQTDEGIKVAQDNIPTLSLIIQTSEAGIPKAAMELH